jgi:hypothetical protein
MTDLLKALLLVSASFGIVSLGAFFIYAWMNRSRLRFWKF